ncbi:MAG: DUF2064 domain-containing protein, partial [Bacteroidia bacterium]|nr:DUF2064 domain-containing protein [Bacteroidia bacterium]
MAQTALLIFANTPQQELASKALVPQFKPSDELRLAQAMVSYARQVAYASKLPVVEIFSDQQVGHNFAERYTHAIAQVFAMGYQNVISIGGDCPGLRVSDLRE